MSGADWNRVKSLFGECLALDPDARAARLRVDSEGPEVVAEVEQLLAMATSTSRALHECVDRSRMLDGIAHDEPLPAGTRIGAYELRERIGTGGMGAVYRAVRVDGEFDREVAIKLLRGDVVDGELVARLRLERQLLARLDHPSIARLFDGGVTPEGRPYLVMELVRGERIDLWCDARRLPIQERLQLFLQVCDAVAFAHRNLIVHRDIKPGNVIVADDGTPKLLDFGIAKVLGENRGGDATATALPRMTPQYASPEQIRGETTTTATDVHALGLLLYELLTGRAAFDGDPEVGASWVHFVCEVDPPRLSSRFRVAGTNPREASSFAVKRNASPPALARLLRGDLDAITAMALRKEPLERYANASALADDLRAYIGGRPVRARRDTRRYRIAKLVRRRRTAFVGATATLCVAFAGLGAWSWQRAATIDSERTGRARSTVLLPLFDVRRLEGLRARAANLYPARPNQISAMEAWITDADALVRDLPILEATLEHPAELSRSAALTPELVGQQGDWLATVTATTVKELERFSAADPRIGDIAAVRRRLEQARTIEAETVDAHRGEWDAACAGIAADARYGELRLRPQIGLVPLGRDPHSGLWEFWQVETGEKPALDPKRGEWRVGERGGLVLVLVPASTVFVGGSATDRGDEIHLDAYFISKYEMTQGEWLHVTGANPSGRPAGHEIPGFPTVTLEHPVESVSVEECTETLHHLGLELPSEAQWLNAARAGTKTTWWTGDAPESLVGAENLADLSAVRAGAHYAALASPLAQSFDDEWPIHAPVGSFRANPWGIHDIQGNVMEWAGDGCFPYHESVVHPGDGLRMRIDGRKPEFALWMGYAFNVIPDVARPDGRDNPAWGTRNPQVGVRPVKSIDP